MEKLLEKLEIKSLNSPEDVRKFDKGKLELINIGGVVIGRATFEPGWSWSESVKPLAKTKSCEAPHFQYHISGTLKVRMDDGTERILKAGDVSLLPPGHDAWVIGNEPVVVVDFQGMADYAKKQ
ncbi:MAG: cupin domain-containing protein [Elusimicrobia bacterium]|nr:cupin domain-containing protein [Candidatus Obscuribacterium magneticum]